MIPALLRYWNSLPVAQLRDRQLPARLAPYIPRGGHILDIGSGNGAIASGFVTGNGAESVCGVDTLLHPDPVIPVSPFDGLHLPFDTGCFDMVTLIDVLHHTDTPGTLLGEAARVSKGPVLVKDHYWKTRADLWTLRFSDYLGNRGHGVALPYNFQRMEQWDRIFADLSLTAVSTERFHYGAHDLTKQVIFLLTPAD